MQFGAAAFRAFVFDGAAAFFQELHFVATFFALVFEYRHGYVSLWVERVMRYVEGLSYLTLFYLRRGADIKEKYRVIWLFMVCSGRLGNTTGEEVDGAGLVGVPAVAVAEEGGPEGFVVLPDDVELPFFVGGGGAADDGEGQAD